MGIGARCDVVFPVVFVCSAVQDKLGCSLWYSSLAQSRVASPYASSISAPATACILTSRAAAGAGGGGGGGGNAAG
eukprot:5208946-Pyramimonas_sp.AAC.1